MRIRKFNELFGFGGKKEVKLDKPVFRSKLDECSYDIILFLRDNGITTWDEFMGASSFQRSTIDSIIDSYCDTKSDMDEVKYRIRLQIGSRRNLLKMLSDCELREEYEKCSEIKMRLDTL